MSRLRCHGFTPITCYFVVCGNREFDPRVKIKDLFRDDFTCSKPSIYHALGA